MTVATVLWWYSSADIRVPWYVWAAMVFDTVLAIPRAVDLIVELAR